MSTRASACTTTIQLILVAVLQSNYLLFRYLLHFADLSFLEAVSQTLTSAQVGIKSEVARSNSQAREIFQYIDKITATVKQVQAKVRTLHLYSTHSHTHTHKHTHLCH